MIYYFLQLSLCTSPDGKSREGGSQRLECIIRTTKNHVIGSELTSVSFRMPAIDGTFSRSSWSVSLLMEAGRWVCFGACPPMVPIQLHHRPSAGVGIITPVGCSWHHCGHCPLGFFAFNWGLYFAPWKLRAPILPSGLFVFSLLVDEATVLSKVKRLNCSFRSREVLNHGFLCSRRVGQREEGTGTDPKRQGHLAVHGLLLTIVLGSIPSGHWLRCCAVLCLAARSFPTLCDPMDCSPPGFSVHGDSPDKNT